MMPDASHARPGFGRDPSRAIANRCVRGGAIVAANEGQPGPADDSN